MAIRWERCEHCRGDTKCNCGSCREWTGPNTYTYGVCSVCRGEGGWNIDTDTGQPPIDPRLFRRRPGPMFFW